MYICKPIYGRLAQLVQSTSFTPRGSGVRTPHRPQVLRNKDFFYMSKLNYAFYSLHYIQSYQRQILHRI